MPKDEDQTILLEQLQQYVTIASQSKSSAYHAKDVKTLIASLERGHCSGISALWLYHKSRHSEKYFYDSIINPILAWDGTKKTLLKEKELENTLEYMLSVVEALQASTMFKQTQSGIPTFRGIVQEKLTIRQTDYDLLINLIKQDDYPSLRKEYEIGFVFTNNELQEFLKSIQANKLISLSSSDHTIALFFDGQEYTLFDPNGFFQASTNTYFFEKQFAANEIKNLVKNIQYAFMYAPDSSVTGLTIAIFDSINNPMPDYLDREKRIQKILDTRIKNKELININEGNSYDSWTPIYFAAKNGYTNIVKLLLRYGAKIEKIDNKSQSPIYIAAENGHAEIVEILLQHGATINKADNNSNTPIHTAAYNNHFAVLETLLHAPASEDIIDAPVNSGETPLYFATQCGHTKIVKLLLQHGAKIEKAGNNSNNPIHVAACNNHFAVLEALLHSPASKDIIDTPLNSGETPLYLATQYGHTKIVELLLRHGAKIKKADNDSWNPIHVAILNNHSATLNILLNALESKDIIDAPLKSGKTPLYLAAENGHTQIIERLLHHGAKIKKTNNNLWGPIHIAIVNNHFTALKALLHSPESKDIINTPLNSGETLLYLAAQCGNTEIVELLLEHGAKIENANNNSLNPIHIAIVNNHFTVLKALLHSPESENIIDIPLNSGETPLYLAALYGHTEIVELLLRHGAKIEKTNNNSLNSIDAAEIAGHIEIVQLLKSEQLKQSKILKEAKHAIQKNWIDKDYTNLVKIKTAYLTAETRIKALNLEVIELSKYYLGLRESRTLPMIQSKMERLNEIEKEVKNLAARVDLQTNHIPIDNPSRKNHLIVENEKIFFELLNNIKDCRVNGQNAKKEILSTATPAVTVHLSHK